MKLQKVLLTGATGFIGLRLAQRLARMGCQVDCLVRKKSTRLAQLGLHQICRDLSDPAGNELLSSNYSHVFHLAAATTAIRSRTMIELNSRLTENLFESLDPDKTGKVVVVSSLAANGPSSANGPTVESDFSHPVSNYGRSKLATERISLGFASKIPVSIVRPPIVIGGGDGHSFEMFKTIFKTGVHFVPGFRTRNYSMIHVNDLVESLIAVAERGQFSSKVGDSNGLYYAAADEVWTYAEIGKQIGQALGQSNTRVVPVGPLVMRMLALANEVVARIRGKQGIVNWDKTREALAGSWACSNQKLKNDLGVEFRFSLASRIEQTVAWYRDNGWLPLPKNHRQPSYTRFRQKQKSN